jgi:hypothetical protein
MRPARADTTVLRRGCVWNDDRVGLLRRRSAHFRRRLRDRRLCIEPRPVSHNDCPIQAGEDHLQRCCLCKEIIRCKSAAPTHERLDKMDVSIVTLGCDTERRKKSSRKAWVPGGQRTRVFSGSNCVSKRPAASMPPHAFAGPQTVHRSAPSRADPPSMDVVNGSFIFAFQDRSLVRGIEAENRRNVFEGQGRFARGFPVF